MIVAMEQPKLLTPRVFYDDRGYFFESYRATWDDLPCDFVQDNHSSSKKDVIRGMHFQKGQAKLVRCVRGAIFDVLVDIRPVSPQFGTWVGYELTEENHNILYVPDGFAHGFRVLSEDAVVLYKVSTEYDPTLEGGFRYDDQSVGIDWNCSAPLVSARDLAAAPFEDVCVSGL